MLSNTGILIVEDEAIIASAMEVMLRRRGYNPIGIAGTGMDAIRKVRELHPGMVLMDVRLRGSMSGIEAGRQIEAEHSLLIIYMTAFTAGRALQLPPSARYLPKPFAPAQLFDAIESALAQETTKH